MANMFEAASRKTGVEPNSRNDADEFAKAMVQDNEVKPEPAPAKKEEPKKEKQEPEKKTEKPAKPSRKATGKAEALLKGKLDNQRDAKAYTFYLDKEVYSQLEALAKSNKNSTSKVLNELLKSVFYDE